MKNATRVKPTSFVEDFVRAKFRTLGGRSVDTLKEAYPFHRLFFGDEGLVGFSIQRSVVTSMGQKLFPGMAEIIAREHYKDVRREYKVEGPVNDAAVNMIEQIVTELRAGTRSPNHKAELSDILGSRGGGSSNRSMTADLFIGDFPEGPVYFDITGPTPNLNVAAGLKRNLLYFLTIMSRKGVHSAKAWVAFHHNPYLTREQYKHSFTSQILQLDAEVLMGTEFWNLIGGPQCYTQLLEIITEVRERTASLLR